MFIYVDTAEENLAKPFLTLYGLESDKRPVIVSVILESILILFVNVGFQLCYYKISDESMVGGT
jgi:hypothetical protein